MVCSKVEKYSWQNLTWMSVFHVQSPLFRTHCVALFRFPLLANVVPHPSCLIVCLRYSAPAILSITHSRWAWSWPRPNRWRWKLRSWWRLSTNRFSNPCFTSETRSRFQTDFRSTPKYSLQTPKVMWHKLRGHLFCRLLAGCANC